MPIAISLSKFVPKYTAPGLSSMIQGFDAFADPNEQLFQTIAEKQIEQEADSENFLFTLLDYLVRPQRAVAGFLKDMVDGGDFHPLDRVGRALAGEERFGIKDVIDEIMPGRWSNVKLPDFLGGKDVDLAKETVGFIGDVLTDPLMSVRLGTAIGKAAKFGAEEAKFLRELAAKEVRGASPLKYGRGGSSKIFEAANEASEHWQKVVGTGGQITGALTNIRTNHRDLFLIWEKMAKDPKAFARSLRSREARVAMRDPRQLLETAGIRTAGKTRDELEELAESFLTSPRAAPTAYQRFARGEQALVAFKMPWLMRKLGIPDGKWSLIPKLDRQWGNALAKMNARIIEPFWNTSLGGKVIKPLIDKIFKAGTGVAEGDLMALQIGTHGRLSDLEIEDFMREMRDAFGGNYNSTHHDIVLEYLMHPKNAIGKLRDIPENYQGIPLRQIVEKTHDILYRRALQHNLTPGLKHRLIGGQFSDRQAHRSIQQLLREKYPETTTERLTDFAKIKKMATERTAKIEKDLDAKLMLPADAARREWVKAGFYKTEVGKIVKAELDRAAGWLGDLSALKAPWETGYFPRFMTDEAKDLLQQIIEHPSVKYKNEFAGAVFKSFTKGRNLREFDVRQINEMVRDGMTVINGVEYHMPVKFIDEVYASARKNLRGKSRQMWERWMNSMEHDRLRLFMEDPMQATYQYLVKTAQATTKQRQINHMSKLFMRPIHNDAELSLGERYVILSKAGMENLYGPQWREKIGDVAYKAYQNLQKEGQLFEREGLGGLVLELRDINKLSLGRGFDLPVFAVNPDIYEGLNKWYSLVDNPETWRPVTKLFRDVTNMWKSWTLFIFPSYHVRNFTSLFSQAWFADSMALEDYAHAGRLFRGAGLMWEGHATKRAGGLAKAHKTVNLEELTIRKGTWNNMPYSAHQMVDDLYRYDVLQGSFYMRELIQNAKGEFWGTGLTKASPPAEMIQWLRGQKGPTRWGAWVGNMSDNWHRVAMYSNGIRNGLSPYQAAMKVKKYLFDYNELGVVEKNLLRNVFPFWTWTRKNVPLQLEFLMTNPGKFAQLQRTIELFQTDEAKKMDRSLLPNWVSRAGGIPVRINKETGNAEVKLLGSWSPAADLRSVASIHDVFRTAMGLLNPIPKGLLENFTNRSFFTEKPIYNYPGEPAETPFLFMNFSKRMVHNLKSFRILNEFNKLTSPNRPGGEVPLLTRAVDFIGFLPKTKAFDVERLKARRKREVAERKGLLKRGYSAAKKVSDRQGQAFTRKVKGIAGLDL